MQIRTDQQPDTEQPGAGREAQRPLVLMVDDVPANIHVLAQALQSEYDVMIATDGASTLQLVREQEQPDLILLDIMMPGMDGYEVCRQLKSDPQTRDIPIIFITARDDPEAEALGFKLGGVDYITKPFSIPVVRARMRTQLNLRGLVAELERVNGLLNDRLSELQTQYQTLLEYTTEREERRSRQQLLAQVLENTNDGVLITSARGEILAVNQAFTRITGYQEAEVLGRNPRLLKSGRHGENFYRLMWEQLQRHGSWSGEVWNLRKNQEVFSELLTISSVSDEQGEVGCYIGVFTDITRLKEVQQRMDFLTWHDPLTGLPNRLLLTDRLGQALARGPAEPGYGALLAFSLTGYGMLAASRGSARSDQLLHGLARELRKDLEPGVTLARLEVDHFALLLPRAFASAAEAARHARLVADRIRERVWSCSEGLEQDLFQVRATIGVALFPDARAEVAAEVVQRAETARIQAHHNADGRPVFFETSIGQWIEKRLTAEQELRWAIGHDELRVFLQSQVDAEGQLVAAEALVRWQHPERGLLPAPEFIALAEQSGLIVELDRWVLRQVVQYLARYPDSRWRHLAVNVSAHQFHRDDFVAYTLGVLQQAGVEPSRLVLELTESTLLEGGDEVMEKMSALVAQGLRFSIDDFGTGYSSLAYLHKLPIAELKIDRSFVQALDQADAERSLVGAIIEIGHRFQLQVVAEGVETQPQRQALQRLAPVLMQGYLFDRPCPADDWFAAQQQED